MPRLKDNSSLRVVVLTITLATMTTVAVITGIFALQEFKEEYQELKDVHFERLLKMTELKGQSNEVLRASTEMFLSVDKNELQWDLLKISDKQLWIDKLFSQLTESADDHQDLLILKLRLYKQISAISEAMLTKFESSNFFFIKYERAENYKRSQIKKRNLDMAVAIDRAMSHFNPIVNKKLIVDKDTDLNALDEYIFSTKGQLSDNEYKQLINLFLDKSSLASAYQNYTEQLDLIEELRQKNEELSNLIATVTGANVLAVQNRFVTNLYKIEESISKRKSRLYALLVVCLLIALTLVFLQAGFLRRVYLIKKVIDSGYSKTQNNIPIKGKDEISEMAKAVKGYIDQLLAKEQEISDSNKKLEYLATHDGLIGIFNRRYFDSTFEQEHMRYLRYKETYCLAMFDLDFFKRINDSYGHVVGDKVLIDFSSRVAKQIRKTDIFARLGGEEFVLLMPRTVESDGLMLMERIRESINAAPCISNELEIAFSTSIGLVEVQKLDDMGDASTQLSLADKALYEAKQTGRNKVCVYHSE